MKTDKTTKWLGKLTAKTITITESVTAKTVNGIKNTPKKTADVSKIALGGFSTGYRTVRPKKDDTEVFDDTIDSEVLDSE